MVYLRRQFCYFIYTNNFTLILSHDPRSAPEV